MDKLLSGDAVRRELELCGLGHAVRFGSSERDAHIAALARAEAAEAALAKAREDALREAADLVESFAPGGERYENGHDDASMRVAIRGAILGISEPGVTRRDEETSL